MMGMIYYWEETAIGDSGLVLYTVRGGESSVSVAELVAAFLQHAKATLKTPNYTYYRIVLLDFLLKLYGGDTTALFVLARVKSATI